MAEVRGKKDKDTSAESESGKEQTRARQYWQPQKILARIGVSVYMAGDEMIKEIFTTKPDIKLENEKKPVETNKTDFKPVHPIASLQVCIYYY